MSKKVLVITGSPRKGGNTDVLADTFIKGCQEAGNEILRFDAGRKNMIGCKNCNACYSKGEACVWGDDFNELAPMMLEADAIVFVTPLYWFTFPAQIKAAIDKIYALLIGQKEIKIRESMMIVCGETEATEVYQPIVDTYKTISNYCKWEDRGCMVVPAVYNVGDVNSTDWPSKAEEMGKQL